MVGGIYDLVFICSYSTFIRCYRRRGRYNVCMNQNNKQFRFENEQYSRSRAVPSNGRTTVMSSIVMKLSGGLVKNQTQATVAMVLIIIVCFVLALITMLTFSGSEPEINTDVPYLPNNIIDDSAL